MAVRVKICGVTRREDAMQAIALGADALGFNLYPGSKRHLSLEREAGWIQALPPFVTRVAVLVNVSLDEAGRIAAHPAIDLVQFHGDEDERYCADFAASGRSFIKALRLRDRSGIAEAPCFSTLNILLDACAGPAFGATGAQERPKTKGQRPHAGAAYGGTGTLIDLALAAECVRQHPNLRITLAGGLTPENAAHAVRTVGPYALDVASGVESASGVKDALKMEAFIRAAKRMTNDRGGGVRDERQRENRVNRITH